MAKKNSPATFIANAISSWWKDRKSILGLDL